MKSFAKIKTHADMFRTADFIPRAESLGL